MADVTQNYTLNPFGGNVTGSGTVNVNELFTLNLTTGSTLSATWSVTTQPSSGAVRLSTTTGVTTVATYRPTVAGVYTFVISNTAFGSTSTLTYTATVNSAANNAPTFTSQPELDPVGQPVAGNTFGLKFIPNDADGSAGLTAEVRYNTTNTNTGGIYVQGPTAVTSGASTTLSGIPAGDANVTRYYFVRLTDGTDTTNSNTVAVTPTQPVVSGEYGMEVRGDSGTPIWGPSIRNEWMVADYRMTPLTITIPANQLSGSATVAGLDSEGWTLANSDTIDVFFVDSTIFLGVSNPSITRRSNGFTATYQTLTPVAADYDVTLHYLIMRF